MARYYIIAGERSGDYLGSVLASVLTEHDPTCVIRGWGGSKMHQAGVDIAQDISDIQVMGWTDVILRIPKFMSLLSDCKKDMEAFDPDKVVLIDFGGFNLRIAQWAHTHGYLVDYLSPPKVWASREGRLSALMAYCHQLITLFPFEAKYFNKKGIKATCVGHPLVDDLRKKVPVQSFIQRHGLDKERPIMAVIPGSRSAEIKYCLPHYLRAAKRYPDFQICISVVSALKQQIRGLSQHADVHLIPQSDFHQLLLHADRAIITSGTATLEAAIIGTPQVVCYRTNWFNYQLGKRLIKTPYISLPNLISATEVVPELIQKDCTATHIDKTIRLYDKDFTKSDLQKAYSGIINEILFNKELLTSSVAI